MRYLTKYNLTADNALIEDYRMENDNAMTAFDNLGQSRAELSWYNWREELQEFSKKHPDNLFLLSGSGENDSNLWQCYVMNGKSQLVPAITTYAEFDPNQLIEFEDDGIPF